MIARLLKQLKPLLRWLILGGTLFFIAKTLKDHWQEVAHLQLSPQSIYLLPAAFSITLGAHIWSGWVWHWVLALLHQPQPGSWTTPIYLKTNVAKYLPGNVWHFWGRIRALQQTKTPTGTAILAVIIEPLLMAIAALIWACLCGSQLSHQLIGHHSSIIQGLVLASILIAIHPRIFNLILKKLSQAKAKAQKLPVETPPSPSRLQTYPLKPLLGEMGFIGARSLGFILIIATFTPTLPTLPTLITAFSLAWLLGLIVPGAPGGIGIFEATTLFLLTNQLPAATLLSSIALYRLISILAEVTAAGAVWLLEHTVKTR